MRFPLPSLRRVVQLSGLALLAAPAALSAAAATAHLGASRVSPNLVDQLDRPLRYRPDGADFVIENGTEFFNRPLYGGNTAFRVDGGDRPEFVLYLPGRGGNLRFGVRAGAEIKWLHEAARIVTRYRPGELRHEIEDPSLGAGTVLRLATVAPARIEGLIVRAELVAAEDATRDSTTGAEPLELVWAYGGVSGQRGKRDGDIGTESVPISEWFQLQPQFCRGNEIEFADGGFLLRAKPATIVGLAPTGAHLALADAATWNNLPALLADAGSTPAHIETPIVVGRAPLATGRPLFIGLLRLAPAHAKSALAEDLDTYREVTAPRVAESSTFPNMGGNPMPRPPAAVPAKAGGTGVPPVGWPTADDLPRLFADTERHFRELRQRVRIETPDPFLNAAVGALNVAADAVWDDPQQAIMHGAIAWRTRLLGWRGPYALDALGWHDRARKHFTYWTGRQNTDPIPATLPPADEKANLARNETGLHSNGDLSNSHYDMNLVAIDALFRHLRWTGDRAFAEAMWPVIERHLAWERRLFRREFGPENLPLYEAYAAIWASDDLQYHGGGAAHATAYNYFHHREAARLARWLGHDAAPYEREADLIARGMRAHLWRPERGGFAEFKDLLGLQRVHPSAGVWTFYHAMDSVVPTPQEAWMLTRQVETEIPHLPVRGPGVPEGLHVLSTTNWMPYTWSINNVVFAENVHTALGFWQADRPDEAWTLTKGSLLAAMFMGISPGNVGSMSYLDVYRRESQRDFADGSGVLSRALIEGLFGLQPDVIDGEFRVKPSFPAEWNRASLRHPDISLRFERNGDTDHYVITQRFSRPLALRLQLRARGERVGSLAVNGDGATWTTVDDAVGAPRIEITSPAGFRHEVLITWAGSRIRQSSDNVAGLAEPGIGVAAVADPGPPGPVVAGVADPGRPGSSSPATAQRFTRVEQGQMRWWKPSDPSNRWSAPDDTIPPTTRAVAGVADPGLPGSSSPATSPVRSTWSAVRYTPPPTGLDYSILPPDARFEPVDLAPHFNDRVTQIFRNEYRSPRSSYVSLALPKQGIGGWAGGVNATAEIDDTGLRAVAAQHGGRLVLPNGVPLATPGLSRGTGVPPVNPYAPVHGRDARATPPDDSPAAPPNNILFTSLWDNYPDSATVPLSGRARALVLLLAGSTNHMQSRFENGEIVVTYVDGSVERLALENPTNWWPVEQDYFVDDFQFRRPGPLPIRVDLKTGRVRELDPATFKGRGGRVPGGAATVLSLPLRADRELQSLTVRTLANEVVIGLMAATLVR